MIVGYCILNGKKWVMFEDKQCAAGEVKLTDGFKDKLIRCRKGVREMWQRGVECDGKCYTDEGICPRAEWCDKTRKGEFAATALAGFFFLVVLVMLAPGMIALKLLDWVYGKLYWRES